MRAVRLDRPYAATIVSMDDPDPGPGQVVVRVGACGICGSDMHSWRGAPGIGYPLPAGAPGHEVWGTVEAVGPGVDLRPGQHVTGLVQQGYAERALAEASELVVTGDDLILGEPLACAANVVRRSGVEPGMPIAVVGFGYLAALIVRLLFPEGGDWIAISRRPASRALAAAHGARATYPFEAVDAGCWDRFPVVIEVAGVQQALDYATWLTAHGGRLVIAGYHADGPRTVNMQSWNWKGIDVVNAHERQPAAYLRGLRDGLAIVDRHHLDLGDLISHRYGLDAAGEALATADARPEGYVKGIVTP